MKKREYYIFFLTILVFEMMGCTTPQVIEKLSENEAKISLGSSHVAVGDTVLIKESVCQKIWAFRNGNSNKCTDEILDRAEVVRLLNKDESIVRLNENIIFSGHIHVEKAPKLEKQSIQNE